MRRLALVVLTALVVAAPTGAATAARLVYARGGALFLGGQRIAAGSRPAPAPDGFRVAFVAPDGTLALVNVDGSGRRRVTTYPVESASWSPDGKRLVVARPGARWLELALVDPADGRTTPLATGLRQESAPAWSPDGKRIAFAADEGAGFDLYTVRPDGNGLRRLTRDGAGNADPAWSPDGRTLAFVSLRGGVAAVYAARAGGGPAARRLTWTRAPAQRPAFSTDGRRLAFATTAGLYVARADGAERRRVGAGSDPAWIDAPPAPLVLPNLDQLAPRHLVVQKDGDRSLLGFDSAALNAGTGALEIDGSRPRQHVPMDARQIVHLRGGGTVVREQVGILRFVRSSSHDHWHFVPFETYELRRAADFALVGRDRKSGFCLGDRSGHATHGAAPPRFQTQCGLGDPTLLQVHEGISPGWIDRYPAYFHGQFVDVTGLPAGLYDLTHRVNPRFELLESNYADDAASVLLRLEWRAGVAAVTVLKTCPASERCR